VTSDLVIKSMGDNNDILFKGLDASSTITALTLDMSEAGAAIFNSTLTATDITANSLTTNVITSNGSNADISIQPSGTGNVEIGALTINGTTIFAAASGSIQINDPLDIDQTLTVNAAQINFLNIPTSDPGVAGRVFRDGTDLKVSTG
jgi:hypothetical protein